jgi:HEAT repeat protein
MIAYCTHCWRGVNSEDRVCPACEADLALDHRTYEEKLIGALAHPLPAARVRICWLIGESHIRQAVSDLMGLATSDPDLFVRKAALESLGVLRDQKSTSRLRTMSRSENRFLAAAAKKSLEAVTQEQGSCPDRAQA